jgi:hypothetical protein
MTGNVLSKLVTALTCVWELPGLNLGEDMGVLIQVHFWLFPNQMLDKYLK